MILPMTCAHADKIAGWTYPGEYALYSFQRDEETLQELMSGAYFACLSKDAELVGYFCFGASARIPVSGSFVYDEGPIDIGLGMRPDLCGKGGGAAFVREGIRFARERFRCGRMRLTVAKFNQRAIRAYEAAGFRHVEMVCHSLSGMEFIIMIREDNSRTNEFLS